MLRVELTTQLLRIRTLVALACLAAGPVIAGLATAANAGHRNGGQGGLFGASSYSALNHTMASVAFIEPQLLPIVVALLAGAITSADRDWGILRYLYVAPVSRARLLTGKLAALALFTVSATLCLMLSGLVTGLAIFGWHPFHIVDAPALSAGETTARLLAASGYILLCMLSIAAIAFALGMLLPHGAEALGTAVTFVIAASILNGGHTLDAVQKALPVHYWQDWTHLFDPSAPPTSAPESRSRSSGSPQPPASPPSCCCAGIPRRNTWPARWRSWCTRASSALACRSRRRRSRNWSMGCRVPAARPPCPGPAFWPDVRALRRREIGALGGGTGVIDTPEFQAASAAFFAAHLCRLDPWPECLTRTLALWQEDPTVVRAMTGMKQLTAAGTLADFDLSDRLAEIDVPVLLITGAHDRVRPWAAAKVHARLAKSQWELFADSSHFPHLEEPERFGSAVETFLRSTEDR
jgi:ABC-2 type transport system permease protein